MALKNPGGPEGSLPRPPDLALSGASGRPRSDAMGLLVTSDSGLMESVMGAAAAARVPLEVRQVDDSSTRWRGFDIVILGSDAIALGAQPPAGTITGEVIVAASGHDFEPVHLDSLRTVAAHLGATHVISLPSGARWLTERFAAISEGPPRGGQVIACAGAVGGSGATTLGAALLGAACLGTAPPGIEDRAQRSLLIDADPWNGGVSWLLGEPERAGLGWADLAEASGRIPPSALIDGLPIFGGIHVLSAGEEDGFPLRSRGGWSSVMDCGRRGFDRVVIDVGRVRDEPSLAALLAADSVVVTTRADPAGVLGAATMSRWLRQSGADAVFAVRENPRRLPIAGMPIAAVEEAVSPFPCVRLHVERRASEFLALGDWRSSRAMRRTAHNVLALLDAPRRPPRGRLA